MIPNCKLWIVGASPTDQILAFSRTDSSITVTGNIPDIRDAFTQSHLLAAPVFSGKGTRYKILEALATETPVVATQTAVEGLGVENKKHVCISNTAEEMAAAVVELLKSKELRKSLAQNGKKYVTEHFDWKMISHKLDIIYQRIGKTNT
jgi:glycosyltransferase involved in cell wall biosynthesis